MGPASIEWMDFLAAAIVTSLAIFVQSRSKSVLWTPLLLDVVISSEIQGEFYTFYFFLLLLDLLLLLLLLLLLWRWHKLFSSTNTLPVKQSIMIVCEGGTGSQTCWVEWGHGLKAYFALYFKLHMTWRLTTTESFFLTYKLSFNRFQRTLLELCNINMGGNNLIPADHFVSY